MVYVCIYSKTVSLLLPSYSYLYSSSSYPVSPSHFMASPVLFLRSVLCLAAARQFSHTSSSHLSIAFPAGLLSPKLIFIILFGFLLSNILITCYWGLLVCPINDACTALTILFNFFTLIFGGECKF